MKRSRFHDIPKVGLKELLINGDAYKDLGALLNDEEVYNRAMDIQDKVLSYPLDSKPVRTWLEKVDSYNRSTTLHALLAWSNDYTASDVFGKDCEYVPQRGVIGTIPPSETFKEADNVDDYNYVVHPYKAFQEVPMSVRWPPPHPPSYPVMTWFALAGLYSDEYIYREVIAARQRNDDIMIGACMEPHDGMRLGNLSNIYKQV